MMRNKQPGLKTIVWIVVISNFCAGFNLPEAEPVDYSTDPSFFYRSDVPVYVNRLNSERTLIPYEYHHFDFCPIDETNSPVENIGQIVFGERIRPSPYQIEFLQDVQCQKVCTRQYVGGDVTTMKHLTTLLNGIRLNYQHNWIVDNMPVTWCYQLGDDREFCSTSFPMGCFVSPDADKFDSCPVNPSYNQPGTYYPFNHVDLTITFHRGKSEKWKKLFAPNVGRITSIKVVPSSINHRNPYNLDCQNNEPLLVPSGELKDGEKVNITYSYSVKFVQNDYIEWSSRWDYILEPNSHINIQLFSVANSVVPILFLLAMITLKILGPIHKEQTDSADDVQKSLSWMAIRGDVFRPPRNGLLLSGMLGSGIQLLCTSIFTLALAAVGILAPTNRGALMTCAIQMYILLSPVAGYCSARIYKSFGGNNWKCNVLLTSKLCSGIVFGLFIVLDAVLRNEDSSGALPIGELIYLLLLWTSGAIPLTLVGALVGFRKPAFEYPAEVNETPREIPAQPFFARPTVGILLGGVLPFGCIFISLFFILNSVWFGQMYNMFGFLFIVFTLMVITCALSTLLLCFFHLCMEDYHWWWRSFFTSGCTSLYVFIYCCYFFDTKMAIDDATSTLLYFGYTFIIVFMLFLLTGTIGFVTCFCFVRKLYKNVHIVVKEERDVKAPLP